MTTLRSNTALMLWSEKLGIVASRCWLRWCRQSPHPLRLRLRYLHRGQVLRRVRLHRGQLLRRVLLLLLLPNQRQLLFLLPIDCAFLGGLHHQRRWIVQHPPQEHTGATS
jgi:hypothetical protein